MFLKIKIICLRLRERSLRSRMNHAGKVYNEQMDLLFVQMNELESSYNDFQRRRQCQLDSVSSRLQALRVDELARPNHRIEDEVIGLTAVFGAVVAITVFGSDHVSAAIAMTVASGLL